MANQDPRIRGSLPLSGLDTSTPDTNVEDGKCAVLHNLRIRDNAWRRIDPPAVKHCLHAMEDNADFFAQLDIVYHHPAAPDDTYIAALPADDGLIKLMQVRVEGETLTPEAGEICAIWTVEFIDDGSDTPSRAVALASRYPVASDVTVYVDYASTLAGEGGGTQPLMIKTGETVSSTYIRNARPLDNAGKSPIPASDATYTYRVFNNEQEADTHDPSFLAGISARSTVGHFGSILIVNDPDARRIYRLYYRNGSYEVFDIPAPPILIQRPYALYPSTETEFELRNDPWSQAMRADTYDKGSKAAIKLLNPTDGTFSIPTFTNRYCFYGEVCIMAAFRMIDGSIVSPSALCVISSEAESCNAWGRQYHVFHGNVNPMPEDETLTRNATMQLALLGIGDDYVRIQDLTFYDKEDKVDQYRINVFNIAIRPRIAIRIQPSINRSLVTEVVIFSTRINSIWDPSKFKDIDWVDLLHQVIPYNKFFAENRLPEQPLYPLKSIPIDEFTSDGRYETYLDAHLFEGIEHKESIYTPGESHRLYYTDFVEYNARVHAYGAMETELFGGYASPTDTVQGDYPVATCLNIDDRRRHAVTRRSTRLDGNADGRILDRILSYPDSRAVYMGDVSGSSVTDRITLDGAPANNYAYRTWAGDSEEAGDISMDISNPPIISYFYVKNSINLRKIVELANEPLDSTPVRYANRLRVSAANNPAVFPLSNTYAIGTDDTRIVAVNSAAVELSDAKFGEFPLYIFTDEGLFAAQSGSGEVLYASVVPVNHDRAINPRTLAVNYSLLYITSQGLRMMGSDGTRTISSPIDTADGDPRIRLLADAHLYLQHMSGEVILHIPPADTVTTDAISDYHGIAYVYSLVSGLWYTRDLQGRKLNNDDIVQRSANGAVIISDMQTEAPPTTGIHLAAVVTRPIKLGSAEYKRLEALVMRFRSAIPLNVQLIVEGSTDLETWYTLRTTDITPITRDRTLRRTPRSFRYMRITAYIAGSEAFAVTTFDLEYYHRFIHRLR